MTKKQGQPISLRISNEQYVRSMMHKYEELDDEGKALVVEGLTIMAQTLDCYQAREEFGVEQ